MSGSVIEIAGVRAFLCEAQGAPIGTEREAADVVGEALAAGVRLVVVPVERFAPGFLDLKTRIAGEVLQKFVTYRRHVVVLGDVSAAAAASGALADFVRESNRGRSVWFARDLDDLAARLGAPGPPA
jgi:hypothetical protein